MDVFRLVLPLGLRTLVGLLLAMALGMTGVGVGWILFVFFGATSHTTLLMLMTGGAAVGTAASSFLAWLQMDNNTLPLLVGTAVLLLLAGVAGAWVGFRFGANQEVPCCAEPEIGPMTYTVVGAAVASNSVALLLGAVQALRRASIHRGSVSQRQFRRSL